MVRSTFDVPQRQALRRIAAQRTARWLVCAVAFAWLAPVVAQAQEASGPIVIPGPGEKNPADLETMKAMATATTGNGARATVGSGTPSAASAARPPVQYATPQAPVDRFAALAGASGAIVIPGSGEPAAPAVPRMIVAAPAQGQGLGAAREAVPVRVTAAQAQTAGAPAGIEIDSLASRGEPPELGASAASRAPARVVNASVQGAQAAQPLRAATGSVATSAATSAAPSGLQTVRTTPAAQAALTVRTVQAGQPAQAPQAAQAAQATQPAQTQHATQAAQPVPADQEDGETIRATALAFLKQQVTGLPGHVEVTVAPAFPRGLGACSTLQPFVPNGARLWGRTTVGVRCVAEHPWTVWMQARVSVQSTYYVAAHPLAPGQVLAEADLVARDGDLTLLPQSIITAPSQAVGAVALMRVGAGLPLRQDMLKNAASVTAGQSVRVVAQGNGFAISAEGSAMSSATPGQPVRVRTAAGQIIMGIVKDSSTVEIQM